MVVRRKVFTRRSELKDLSLVALVAGITRIYLAMVITCSTSALYPDYNAFKCESILSRLVSIFFC